MDLEEEDNNFEMDDDGDRSEERGDGGDAIDDDDSGEEEHFDIALAASHSYMAGLASVRGRVVLEAGWTGRVPVMAHHGCVFPGETVPMLLPDERDAAVLAAALAADKLFGLLCPDETGRAASGYGVLCEVFEAATGGAGAALSFKARAVHRFRLLRPPARAPPLELAARPRPADVRVLPERAPAHPLRLARLASLDALRRAGAAAALRRLDAAVAPWPPFVYDMFDFRRMRDAIRAYFRPLGLERMLPEDAVSLSFWVASNLSLAARDRLALFVLDDALLRLHTECRHIAQRSALCCAGCGAAVARREHALAMSSEGAHGNYSNPGGHLHDVLTVSRASNTAAGGAPSAEFSWFPGYAWSVALCAGCGAHLGWRFDALRRGLRPQRFFGLCRNYVAPRAAPPEPPL